MGSEELTAAQQRVDRLIEARSFAAARAALQEIGGGSAATDVLRIKLALRERSISPMTAMQRLVLVMRDNPNAWGARELYQEATGTSYADHVSSLAHSHPRLHAVRPPEDES